MAPATATAPAAKAAAAAGLCTRCLSLGHNCEAQREYNLCIFCEDGEPCPVMKGLKKDGKLPAPPIDLPPVVVQPLRSHHTKKEETKPAPPPAKPRAANDFIACQCEDGCRSNSAPGKPFAWGHGWRYKERMEEKRRQEALGRLLDHSRELKLKKAGEISEKPKPMRSGPALATTENNDWMHKGFTKEIDVPVVRKTEVEVVQPKNGMSQVLDGPKDTAKDPLRDVPAYELMENADYEQRYAPKTAEYRLLQEVLPKMTVGQVVVIGCQAGGMSRMGKRLLRAFEEYSKNYDTGRCKGLDIVPIKHLNHLKISQRF